MVEFIWKSDSRGIKIARVNSIRITKSIDLLRICKVLTVEVRCDRGRYSVHSPFTEKSMLVPVQSQRSNYFP